MVKPRWKKVVGYVVLFVFLLLILAPFYWMVITSFKPDLNIASYPPQYVPKHWTFTHYVEAFKKYGFGIYIRNSVIVSTVSMFFVLVFGSMAGFSLARLPVGGRRTILIGLLIVSMFPEIAVVSPLYVMLKSVHWLNSFEALVIPYTAFNLPFAIWILRNYFVQVPTALFEAASVDGAGVFRTFYQIFLPVTTPGLFTAAVFSFVACWTEFLFALVFNSSNSMRTIPVGIALFAGQFSVPYGTIFAGSVVSVVPIVILVILFRKWIVSGLTQGAVKG
ncbi:carbohydrate ABC transporter permease [Alicyclobacillus curvatus]|jgi:multiple sugar transport system permease protein|nr:carbohydrate ABC transporter permease [Alicyclobacillus curvatus]